MRFRIGYGGPSGYRHGYKGPRPGGGKMSEIERFIHLIVSLQILFGSRRGGILLPVLLVGLAVGGWFAYNHFFSSDASLRKADALWNSGESENRNKAVGQYKVILRKKDPTNNQIVSLKMDRDRLYRRIIQHHVLFDLDTDDARDWIKNAFEEQFTLRDMNFGDEKVKSFWNEVIEQLKRNKMGSSPGSAPSTSINTSPNTNTNSSANATPTAPAPSVEYSLRGADRLWNTGNEQNQIAAVNQYKEILREKDPRNKAIASLTMDRDRLYRRIIEHHVRNNDENGDARDWIKNAWEEHLTLRDMNFSDEKTKAFWNEVVEDLKRKKTSSNKKLEKFLGWNAGIEFATCS